MTRSRIFWAAIGLTLLGASAANTIAQTPGTEKKPAVPRSSAKQNAPPPAAIQKVEVHARLDRTAIWVADRLTYTIELRCQPDVDILSADLAPEKLALENFKLLGNDIDREVGAGDVTTYKFRYYLTTYNIDTPTLRIGALMVRYYVKRQGQRLEDSAPLGDVQVPAASVAFRSMIPDDQLKPSIRDGEGAIERRPQYAMLPSVGLGLIVISIVPATLFLAAFGRRVWQRTHRSPRQAKEEERASLEAVRSMDVSTTERRREVYLQLNALVRSHLADVCGVPALSLTPVEIGPALSACGATVPAELAASVLSACELALYAPVDVLPTAEACRQTVEQAGRVLASGR